MEPFNQGILTGIGLATGLTSILLQAISRLKNNKSQPIIMEKVTIPSGGKAYGKKDLSKRSPKVMTELKEWQIEQEKEE